MIFLCFNIERIIFFLAYQVKMEDFLITAKKIIPNLIGLKFASKDLGDLIGCLFAGKFNILCGCDEVNIYVKETNRTRRV